MTPFALYNNCIVNSLFLPISSKTTMFDAMESKSWIKNTGHLQKALKHKKLSYRRGTARRAAMVSSHFAKSRFAECRVSFSFHHFHF